MCTQYYSSFTQCPCQLKRLFWLCKHGRLSPKCKSVQKVVLKSGDALCDRNLWVRYGPDPLCRESVSSATVADTFLFPPPADPYDSSCWESEPDPDPESEDPEIGSDTSSGSEYSGNEDPEGEMDCE
ncbi:uncharacterized protein F4817DRAFT_315576 [Daldinia loculata]|uniref:uncharacterized protein n=1 Tax=Daldinia loculata TaxID=103429 RepID=UPI0020C2ACFD|nr:uncharacterized protein F4817DRAFT_315576 [Daldinia loculata]KAI1647711.1 hypothetical protein F4817DRAFT_315576 [Daldinia loculata]